MGYIGISLYPLYFMRVPETGVEPVCLSTVVFKTTAYAVPPLGQKQKTGLGSLVWGLVDRYNFDSHQVVVFLNDGVTVRDLFILPVF